MSKPHHSSPALSDGQPPEPVWWIDSSEGSIGPLTTNEILYAVRCQRITPVTPICPPGCSYWVEAGSVSDLPFHDQYGVQADDQPTDSPEKMRALIAECADRQRSRHGAVPRSRAERDSRKTAVSLGTFLSLLGTPTAHLWPIVLTSVSTILLPVAVIARSRVAWVLLAVVSLATVGGWQFSRWTPRAKSLAQIEEIWQEYRGLRDVAASPDDWQAFRVRAETQLNAITPALTEAARPEDQTSMLLLWLARDALPKALRQPQPKVEEQIAEYFGRIQRHEQSQTSRGLGGPDPLTSLILGLDAIGLGGAAWHFRKSWLPWA